MLKAKQHTAPGWDKPTQLKPSNHPTSSRNQLNIKWCLKDRQMSSLDSAKYMLMLSPSVSHTSMLPTASPMPATVRVNELIQPVMNHGTATAKTCHWPPPHRPQAMPALPLWISCHSKSTSFLQYCSFSAPVTHLFSFSCYLTSKKYKKTILSLLSVVLLEGYIIVQVISPRLVNRKYVPCLLTLLVLGCDVKFVAVGQGSAGFMGAVNLFCFSCMDSS